MKMRGRANAGAARSEAWAEHTESGRCGNEEMGGSAIWNRSVSELTTEGERRNLPAMLGSTVKEFARASPFLPFVLQMNDGRRFTVRHPDFISVSPKGGKVIVYDANENETHLSGLLVASVQPVQPRKSRRTASL